MGQIAIRVQPGARRTGFAGWYGDLPRLAVAAPPVDDAANDEVATFLASQLGVRARSIRIVGGRRSRTKRLAIEGLDDAELLTRVNALNPRPSR